MSNLPLAFGLTLIAGLSTGIGSVIAFFAKSKNKRFLSVSLGFSAGVMIYVSTIEIYPQALSSLAGTLGGKAGAWATAGAFFAGILIIGIIDKLIPSADNPHEIHKEYPAGAADCENASRSKLMRMGVMTALAIGIHNFPEGIATFISALSKPSIAISITVAIAIHNIPEGIAVSVPVYYATGDRKKAFLYSFASGLSEPVGAVIAYLILMNFMNDMLFGLVFAAVAGIMVFISLDELLPTAREYGEHHLSIYGLVGGMAVMAVSLLMFT